MAVFGGLHHPEPSQSCVVYGLSEVKPEIEAGVVGPAENEDELAGFVFGFGDVDLWDAGF